MLNTQRDPKWVKVEAGFIKNHLVSGSGIDQLLNDFIRTILSLSFYPYHSDQYHFVLEPMWDELHRLLASSASGDFVVPLACTATRQKRVISTVGLLFGIVCPLISILCDGICLVLYVNFSRLSSLTEPLLGAPMNTYPKGRYIDSI